MITAKNRRTRQAADRERLGFVVGEVYRPAPRRREARRFSRLRLIYGACVVARRAAGARASAPASAKREAGARRWRRLQLVLGVGERFTRDHAWSTVAVSVQIQL